MLTRWGCPDTIAVAIKRIQTRNERRRLQLTLRLLDTDGFIWPTLVELERAQSQHAPRVLPQELRQRADGLIVHGDRGRQAMMTQLSKVFYLPTAWIHSWKLVCCVTM